MKNTELISDYSAMLRTIEDAGLYLNDKLVFELLHLKYLKTISEQLVSINTLIDRELDNGDS